MILSHACGHMTFENHSATAHAKLAPSDDCEDLCGSCLCEDHFMSVPLVACNLSCSFFIIPNSYIHVYSICVALSIHDRSHLARLLLDSRRSLPKSTLTGYGPVSLIVFFVVSSCGSVSRRCPSLPVSVDQSGDHSQFQCSSVLFDQSGDHSPFQCSSVLFDQSGDRNPVPVFQY
jgi:hypothetical protein